MHKELKDYTVSSFKWRGVPPDSSQPSAETYLNPEGEKYFEGEIHDYPQMRFKMATAGKDIKAFKICLFFPQVVTLQAKLPARFGEDLPVEYHPWTDIVFSPHKIDYRMGGMGKTHNSATSVQFSISAPLVYLHDFDLWLYYSPKDVHLAFTNSQTDALQQIDSGQVFFFGQNSLFIPRIDEEKLKIIILRGKYGNSPRKTAGFIVEELSLPLWPSKKDFIDVLARVPNLTAIQRGILEMGYKNILRVTTLEETEQIKNTLGPQASASLN